MPCSHHLSFREMSNNQLTLWAFPPLPSRTHHKTMVNLILSVNGLKFCFRVSKWTDFAVDDTPTLLYNYIIWTIFVELVNTDYSFWHKRKLYWHMNRRKERREGGKERAKERGKEEDKEDFLFDQLHLECYILSFSSWPSSLWNICRAEVHLPFPKSHAQAVTGREKKSYQAVTFSITGNYSDIPEFQAI